MRVSIGASFFTGPEVYLDLLVRNAKVQTGLFRAYFSITSCFPDLIISSKQTCVPALLCVDVPSPMDGLANVDFCIVRDTSLAVDTMTIALHAKDL